MGKFFSSGIAFSLHAPHSLPNPQCSQSISLDLWPLLTFFFFSLGGAGIVQGNGVEGNPFFHLGWGLTTFFSVSLCYGEGRRYISQRSVFSPSAGAMKVSFSNLHHDEILVGFPEGKPMVIWHLSHRTCPQNCLIFMLFYTQPPIIRQKHH